jgi:hypothetical protein
MTRTPVSGTGGNLIGYTGCAANRGIFGEGLPENRFFQYFSRIFVALDVINI